MWFLPLLQDDVVFTVSAVEEAMDTASLHMDMGYLRMTVKA